MEFRGGNCFVCHGYQMMENRRLGWKWRKKAVGSSLRMLGIAMVIDVSHLACENSDELLLIMLIIV